MISYEEYLNKFNNMDYESKKKKIINMLDVIREDGNVFQDIWKLITNIDNIWEWFIDIAFKIIAKSMYSIKEDQIEESISEMERLKSKLENLKEQETKEKAQESNEADELLNKI